MSFSGTLFLLVLGLLIFGPEKLAQVAKQSALGLAKLRSISTDLKSQLQIEMDKTETQQDRPPIHLPEEALPVGNTSCIPTAFTSNSENGWDEISHG
jgi:Sec-independent protein translocase protein TatA